MNQHTHAAGTSLGRRSLLAGAAGLALLLAAPLARADDAADARGLVEKSRITFESLARDKNFGAMRQALKEARGVLIFPQIIKGAFFVGGSGGTGVLLARDEKGEWRGPAFYTIGSASIGIAFGGEAAEAVIVVRSQKALDSLYATKFKVGADGSITAGPVGIGENVAFTSDMMSFSRSKGAFIGLSFDGSVIDVRDGLNRAYYKVEATPLDILVRGKPASEHSAGLRKAVAAATK